MLTSYGRPRPVIPPRTSRGDSESLRRPVGPIIYIYIYNSKKQQQQKKIPTESASPQQSDASTAASWLRSSIVTSSLATHKHTHTHEG